MDAWRHGWVVSVFCLALLALVGLRIAELASHAGSATSEAQVATYGTTNPTDLESTSGPGRP